MTHTHAHKKCKSGSVQTVSFLSTAVGNRRTHWSFRSSTCVGSLRRKETPSSVSWGTCADRRSNRSLESWQLLYWSLQEEEWRQTAHHRDLIRKKKISRPRGRRREDLKFGTFQCCDLQKGVDLWCLFNVHRPTQLVHSHGNFLSYVRSLVCVPFVCVLPTEALISSFFFFLRNNVSHARTSRGKKKEKGQLFVATVIL